MARELVFSVTAADCEWKTTRGSGNGGQKKNKTNSAVHCIHRPSGAHGYSEAHREQRRNRQIAFEQMAKSKEFQDWSHLEFNRKTGVQAAIEDKVNRELNKIRVDTKDENGRWMEVPKNAVLSDVE